MDAAICDQSTQTPGTIIHDDVKTMLKHISHVTGAVEAIHSLLVASAQHLEIEVPMKDSVRDGLLKLMKQDEIFYDESDTIMFRQLQIPRQNIIDIALDYIRRHNSGDSSSPIPWPKEQRTESVDLPRGHNVLFTWKFPTEITNIKKFDFGYDRSGGFVELLNFSDIRTRVIAERIYRMRDDESLEPCWENQYFGKEWDLECSRRLGHYQLAAIFAHFCPGGDSVLPGEQSRTYNPKYGHSKMASAFISQFVKPWNIDNYEKFRWRLSTHIETSKAQSWAIPSQASPISVIGVMDSTSGECLQYHMRVFTQLLLPKGIEKEEDSLYLHRVFGKIKGLSGNPLYIKEKRFSISLRTKDNDLSVFSLLNIHDDLSTNKNILYDLGNLEKCTKSNIHPWKKGAGMAAFAFRIHSTCWVWAKEWNGLFDEIDKILLVDLENILSHEARQNIMYDNMESGFELSELYFTVGQVLRMASTWIEESMDDLKSFVQRLVEDITFPLDTREGSDAGAELNLQNWMTVISHQRRLGNEILSRSAKKQEEIKSLQADLYNATSVREATKSTQLNHYILVFTVVTIFYLPLSFVTALFALGLFSWDHPGQTTIFIATIIGVGFGTYLFSWLFIWVVRKRERLEIITKAKTHIGSSFNKASSNITGILKYTRKSESLPH